MPVMALVYLAISIFLLWFCADWIVDSAAAIARRFHVSELVIGLTIVAMGTSAPEFLVTSVAAFKGLPAISLANVVGSNILNIGFILGLVALIRPVATNRVVLYRDGMLVWALGIGILLLGLTGELGRLSGLALATVLIGYLAFLFRKRKMLPGEMIDEDAPVATFWDYPKLLAGFVGICLGSNLLVDSASIIARHFGVSEWLIGVTIVALGTSLPELVTCLAASVKGKNEMLIGNLLGSNLFNFAGVLGLTCMMHPLPVGPVAVGGLALLAAMVGVLLVFIRTGWRISRAEGLALIAINLGRWIWEFGNAG